MGFPEVIKSHGSLTDVSFIVYEGPKNFIRYLFDYISLDGLYVNSRSQILASKIPHGIKQILNSLLQQGGIELSTGRLRDPFFVAKPSGIDDSRSYWGLFGVFILLPMILFGWIKSLIIKRSKIEIAVLISVILFFIINSIFSTYDQGRSRHFIHIIPFVSLYLILICDFRFFNNYLKFIFLLSGSNVLLGSIFDERRKLFGNKNIFNEETFDCVKENRSSNDPIFKKMEKCLEPYKKIALMMPANSVELFYFGNNYDKLPKHFLPYNGTHISVPDNYEVLLFCSEYENILKSDKYVGELNKGQDIYIRKLND